MFVDLGHQYQCNNTGEIIRPPQDVVTVLGESVPFECIVQGNLNTPGLVSYWQVMFPSTEHKGNKSVFYNDSDYQIAHYQACLTDNGSCCSFVSKLIILNATLELNDTTISCIEFLDRNKTLHLQKDAKLSKQFQNYNNYLCILLHILLVNYVHAGRACMYIMPSMPTVVICMGMDGLPVCTLAT